MREIEKAVLQEVVWRTKENPLTRTELRQMVGAKDSNARAVIQSLRSMGYRIASSAGGKGYWYCADTEEYKAFRAEYIRKASTIINNIKAMDAYTEGQETISGI